MCTPASRLGPQGGSGRGEQAKVTFGPVLTYTVMALPDELRQTHFKFLKEENLDTALQTHVGQVSIGEMTRVSQFSWAIMVHGNATCRGDRG